jgi:hypothetical protein
MSVAGMAVHVAMMTVMAVVVLFHPHSISVDGLEWLYQEQEEIVSK